MAVDPSDHTFRTPASDPQSAEPAAARHGPAFFPGVIPPEERAPRRPSFELQRLRPLLVALAGIAALGALGWGAVALYRSGTVVRVAGGLVAAIGSRASAEPPAAPSVAMPAGDSAAARDSAAATDSAAADSAAADSAAALLVPNPPRLVGLWAHGDDRSKYGDSLSLVLQPDGSASGRERRYGLDQTGWRLHRVERSGRWYVEYPRHRRPRLCMAWEKPAEVTACATMVVTDTIAEGLPSMEFAGRHWKLLDLDPPRTVADSRRQRR